MIALFRQRTINKNGTEMTRAGAREQERLELADLAERKRIEREKQERMALAQTTVREVDAERLRRELEAEKAADAELNAVAIEANLKVDAEKRELRKLDRKRRLNVIVVSVLCGFWELTGQQMFFAGQQRIWPAGYGYAIVLAPLVVPTLSWGFGFFAYLNAKKGLPYQKQLMVMWLFACGALAMNAFQLTMLLNEWFWPTLVGLTSVAGPYIFHSYVGDVGNEANGVSPADVARILKNWALHPIVSFRASDAYSSSMGALTYAQSYLREYFRAKGHLPGQDPIYMPDVAVKRLGWLRRLLDRRVFGASTVTGGRPMSKAESKAPTGKHAVDGGKERGKGESKDSVADAASKERSQPQIPEQGVALAQGGQQEQGRPVFDGVMDQIAAYMNGDTIDLALVPIAGEQGRGARSANDRFPSSEALAEQGARAEGEQGASTADQQGGGQGDALDHSKPEGKVSSLFRRQRGARTRGKATAAALVREYYKQQRDTGVPADKIYGAAAARYVKEKGRGLTISRQGASEVIVDLRSEESAGDGERRKA